MKAFARFKKGNKIRITCYKAGCEGVSIIVILGREDEIDSSFIRGGGVGRLRWQSDAPAKGFSLGEALDGSGYCNCPNCGTLFGNVVVISRGQNKDPLAFGYDPEPA